MVFVHPNALSSDEEVMIKQTKHESAGQNDGGEYPFFVPSVREPDKGDGRIAFKRNDKSLLISTLILNDFLTMILVVVQKFHTTTIWIRNYM